MCLAFQWTLSNVLKFAWWIPEEEVSGLGTFRLARFDIETRTAETEVKYNGGNPVDGCMEKEPIH